jgi:hypothetical protein
MSKVEAVQHSCRRSARVGERRREPESIVSPLDSVMRLQLWLLPTSLANRVRAVNPLVRGWGQYFRVGTSTAAFGEVDRYVVLRFALFLRNKYQWRALGLSTSRVHQQLAATGLYPPT